MKRMAEDGVPAASAIPPAHIRLSITKGVELVDRDEHHYTGPVCSPRTMADPFTGGEATTTARNAPSYDAAQTPAVNTDAASYQTEFDADGSVARADPNPSFAR